MKNKFPNTGRVLSQAPHKKKEKSFAFNFANFEETERSKPLTETQSFVRGEPLLISLE